MTRMNCLQGHGLRGFAWASLLGLGILSGCGDSNPNDVRGRLLSQETTLPQLTGSDYQTSVATAAAAAPQSAAAILQSLTGGNLPCGLQIHRIRYTTEAGTAVPSLTATTAALMLPTGDNAACSGPRPVVLVAHGTTTDRAYNLADASNWANGSNSAKSEAQLMTALLVAQGFVVVAPNYVGHDRTDSVTHPYLVADQQSKDMIDAYQAAQSTGLFKGNGKLFITGYSQGGHVALATHRALQQLGTPVTASAGLSGPYAMVNFADTIFAGDINSGATTFAPLMIDSYQQTYGGLFAQASEIYEDSFTGLPGLMPGLQLSRSALYTALGQATLFGTGSGLPVGTYGVGAGNVLKDRVRTDYLADVQANPQSNGLPPAQSQNPLRKAALQNDLRNWCPTSPVLLCGGAYDPTVFFAENAGAMVTYWSRLPAGLITPLDLQATPPAGSPFASLQMGFQGLMAAATAAAGAPNNRNGHKLLDKYHSAAAPFCYKAAAGFFGQF